MMPATVRVGVIGTGIGLAHLQALQQLPDVAVAGICSARRERAEAVAARHGVPFATDDWRALLARPLDAVVIATPPALHAPIGLAACAAGKHILCEKPLAATVAEARALADAARAAGVVQMVNHQLRQSPPLLRARDLIAAGYLGRPTIADIRFVYHPGDYLRSPEGSTSKAGWYTDAGQAGGIFASAAGPHLIDALHATVGPIAAVAAQFATTVPEQALDDGATPVGVSAEDAFLVLARCADGALATLRAIPLAYHAYGYTIELHGTAGSLTIGPRTLHGATSADRAPAPIDLPDAGVSEQVAHTARFIDAVRAGWPSPAPDFEEGVAIQAVMAACAASARGGGWVPVARA